MIDVLIKFCKLKLFLFLNKSAYLLLLDLEKDIFSPTFEARVLVIGLQKANLRRTTLNAFNMNYVGANTTF